MVRAIRNTLMPLRFTVFRAVPALLIAVFLLWSLMMAPGVAAGHAVTKHEPWLTEDWTQWTSHDCSIVLEGSPWVQTTYRPVGGHQSYSTIVQLRSALPIRQALLRQIQLEKHYDKMSAQKKRSFDQVHLHDLDSSAQIFVYIVNSAYEPPAPVNSGEVTVYFGPDPPRQIALKVANESFVAPIQVNKVKYASTAIDETLNQFEYIFSRTVDGKPPLAPAGTIRAVNALTPFTTEKNNTIRMNAQDLISTGPLLFIAVGDPLILGQKTKKVVSQDFRDLKPGFSFNVADLMYKGKPEY